MIGFWRSVHISEALGADHIARFHIKNEFNSAIGPAAALTGLARLDQNEGHSVPQLFDVNSDMFVLRFSITVING